MKLWGIKTKHYPIRKLRPPFTDLQITDNVSVDRLHHALPLEGYKLNNWKIVLQEITDRLQTTTSYTGTGYHTLGYTLPNDHQLLVGPI